VSKYHSSRTNGYASKKEADYAAKFQALARSGAIRDYREQQQFLIAAGRGQVKPISYVADFVYTDERGRHIVDIKGFKTPVYRLKKKLLFLLHGIEIEEL
jgi:hypothetical protein